LKATACRDNDQTVKSQLAGIMTKLLNLRDTACRDNDQTVKSQLAGIMTKLLNHSLPG